MISDSLLASARVLPASRAASVGRRPTAPVMPLSTTSHAIAAAWVEASSPTSANAGANSSTWARNRSGCEPPAVSRDHPEPVGVGADDVERLGADGARWSRAARRPAGQLDGSCRIDRPAIRAGLRWPGDHDLDTPPSMTDAHRRPRPPPGATARDGDPGPALAGEAGPSRPARREGRRHDAAGLRGGRRRRGDRRRRRQLADRPGVRHRGGQRRQRRPARGRPGGRAGSGVHAHLLHGHAVRRLRRRVRAAGRARPPATTRRSRRCSTPARRPSRTPSRSPARTPAGTRWRSSTTPTTAAPT